MNRAERKFKKKKEREREVRKKILKRREANHEMAKQLEAQERLEREINKAERKPIRKNKPIRNISPALQKTLDIVKKLEDELTADKAAEPRGQTTSAVVVDDAAPATDFAPKYSGEASLEPLGK